MLLATWTYSAKDWNNFVILEKANKKEDNIYFGIGIAVLGTVCLMLFRNTSFWVGLAFAIPFAFLIPILRYKFSYPYLKKRTLTSAVEIYTTHLQINGTTISFTDGRRRLKNLVLIEKNNYKLLEFDIQWMTRKGATNDEFRLPIPKEKLHEAQALIDSYNKPK